MSQVAIVTGAGAGSCFFASPAASFITGAVLMCDGGVTANAGIFAPPALLTG